MKTFYQVYIKNDDGTETIVYETADHGKYTAVLEAYDAGPIHVRARKVEEESYGLTDEDVDKLENQVHLLYSDGTYFNQIYERFDDDIAKMRLSEIVEQAEQYYERVNGDEVNPLQALIDTYKTNKAAEKELLAE